MHSFPTPLLLSPDNGPRCNERIVYSMAHEGSSSLCSNIAHGLSAWACTTLANSLVYASFDLGTALSDP
jgi:hypothetical protein